jgi:hypothetical protein
LDAVGLPNQALQQAECMYLAHGGTEFDISINTGALEHHRAQSHI